MRSHEGPERITARGLRLASGRRWPAGAARRAYALPAAFGNHLVELPGDLVQLYVRDPAGNLVEIDCDGVDELPEDLRAQLKGLWDFNPQTEEHMCARLFVPE